MKKKILQLYLLIFLFSCGDKGIEGFVGEKITITAEKAEDKTDLDYAWILIEQPDGSLLNSSDLNPQSDKNKMNFTPDYAGNYSIDVVISQYGDEISSQSFLFNILDPKEEIKKEENYASAESKNDKEEWLEEDLNEKELEEEYDEEEYDEEEYDEEEYDEEEYDEEEYDEEEYDEEEYDEEEYDEEEKNNTPVAIIEESSKPSDRKTIIGNKTKNQSNKNISIPAKTDRFTIQVVSKKMLKDAEIYASKLIDRGYDAYIQRVIFEENDEIFYRVRIGSYDNINSAYATAKIVSKELGMAAWVDFVREEQKP